MGNSFEAVGLKQAVRVAPLQSEIAPKFFEIQTEVKRKIQITP